MIINGIRFDDTAATVQLDGLTGNSSALRLGMVATVQGQRGADVTVGTASALWFGACRPTPMGATGVRPGWRVSELEFL